METIIKHKIFGSAEAVDNWLSKNYCDDVKIIAISDNGNSDNREYTVFYSDKRNFYVEE